MLQVYGLPTSGGDDGGWLTFEAHADGKSAVVEVAGDHLNFCTERVDLPGVLRTLALDRLAAGASPGPIDDTTIWSVPGASAEEFARVIDAAFAAVLGGGLGEVYEVWGMRQS
jgi:hypothetical protein